MATFAGAPDREDAGRARSGYAWAFFEGLRDPYTILILSFVFVPYFATELVSNPKQGQLMVAGIGVVAGLVAALTAPILGTWIDLWGPRKPLVLLTTALGAPFIASLCLADSMPRLWVAGTLCLVNILFAWNEVAHSSMLPYAAARQHQPLMSALALGLANLVGFVLLLGTLVLTTETKAANLPALLAGPVIGISWIAGLVPFLRYAEDARRTALSARQSLRSTLSALRRLVLGIAGKPDAIRYFAGRALYQDAFVAFLSFIGVFAAGVMRWSGTELIIFGAAGVASGCIGGLSAAWLDAKLGPKNALRLVLWSMVVLIGAMTLIDADTILGLIPSRPTAWPQRPLIGSTADIAFALCGLLALAAQMAAWSSSRTLLIATAPPEETGSYFGLATVSGTATAWLAPTLIGLATVSFGSQQAGFAAIILLLAAGALLIGRMRQ